VEEKISLSPPPIGKNCAGNTNLEGGLCTVDLLITVACFVKGNIFNIKGLN
jgi:hypothetical protein